MIARGTGGKTAFGGLADQLLGDKIPRWIKEFSMASRGRLSAAHVIIRIGRDLYVTYQRDKIMRKPAVPSALTPRQKAIYSAVNIALLILLLQIYYLIRRSAKKYRAVLAKP